jgi:hypothetical protein
MADDEDEALAKNIPPPLPLWGRGVLSVGRSSRRRRGDGVSLRAQVQLSPFARTTKCKPTSDWICALPPNNKTQSGQILA